MNKLFFALFLALVFFVSGCVSDGSTGDAFESVANQCSDSSECRLVDIGSDICPACDKGDESWVCMKGDQAALAQAISSITKITGLFSMILQGTDCSCPIQEFEYACSCEQDQCTKVVAGTNPLFCREATDCEERGLSHDECVGEWECADNTCEWKCRPEPTKPEPVEEEPPEPEVKDCESDRECFNEALLSCAKAKHSKENISFTTGIRIVTLVEQEIAGENNEGHCTVKETVTNKKTGDTTERDCQYEKTGNLVQCRVVSTG